VTAARRPFPHTRTHRDRTQVRNTVQTPGISRPARGIPLAILPRMRAIIADDDPVTTTVLARALERWGIKNAIARDGVSAWAALAERPAPALAIVDWMMPGIDGIEICRRIRRDADLAGMYVLLLTGRGSRTDLIAGLDAGADDYMVKPIDPEELRARVHAGIRIATLQARLADRVSDLQTASTELARLVSTDVLTDVYTRRRWFELAAIEFSRTQRYGRPFSLLVVDLDFFKRVNDTFGHEAGDRLLRGFADLLRVECRQSDIVGRLGGEEFAVLAPETTASAAGHLADRIRATCRTLAIAAPGGIVGCSCSIGVAEVASTDHDIEAVLRRADAALYGAKHSGRDCWKSDAGAASR
jgi:two-component system, cell cycle response regulator